VKKVNGFSSGLVWAELYSLRPMTYQQGVPTWSINVNALGLHPDIDSLLCQTRFGKNKPEPICQFVFPTIYEAVKKKKKKTGIWFFPKYYR